MISRLPGALQIRGAELTPTRAQASHRQSCANPIDL
jgi:hypothetical protein